MSTVPRQPQGPARTAAVEDLIDALRLFTVESDVFVDLFARAHGLGRSDLNAIMWISTGTAAGTPVTVGELGANLGLGAPATTALVDRLEAAGHVRRTRDGGDRRRVTVVMQPAAQQLAAEFFVPLGGLMHQAVADTSVEDLLRAAAIIRRLCGAVTDARHAADS
jgi:DNA-binding MarR family transcriptional regulator